VNQSFTTNKFDYNKLNEIQNEFKIEFSKTSDGYLVRDYGIYRQQKSYQKDNKDEYNA
jgi:hypothetical protein